jgi:signal transduction histidine kinase
VADLLQEAVELLQPRCRHQQVELRWKRPESTFPTSADVSQLGHLFVNVIGNALEAAGPGGWIEVILKKEEGEAVVDVLDSGPGPSPEVADRLFDQFVTSKPEGVGLGLAVARQVAEEHGGNISWRREAGKTWFTLRLPVARSEVMNENSERWLMRQPTS